MKTMQEAKAKFAAKQLSREAQRAVMGGGPYQNCIADNFTPQECCKNIVDAVAVDYSWCWTGSCDPDNVSSVNWYQGGYLNNTWTGSNYGNATCGAIPECTKSCGQYNWLG